VVIYVVACLGVSSNYSNVFNTIPLIISQCSSLLDESSLRSERRIKK